MVFSICLLDKEKYFRKTFVCNPLWYLYKKNKSFKNEVFRVKFKHILYLFSNKVYSVHFLQRMWSPCHSYHKLLTLLTHNTKTVLPGLFTNLTEASDWYIKDFQNYLQRYFYQSLIKSYKNSQFSLEHAGGYGRRALRPHLEKGIIRSLQQFG